MKLSDYFLPIQSQSFDVDFFDVRIEETKSTQILIKDSQLVSCLEKPSLGAFIRVFHNGAWSYRSTTGVTQLHTDLEELVALSKNKRGTQKYNPNLNQKNKFFRVNGSDFLEVPLIEKKELLQSYLPIVTELPFIKSSSARYTDIYKKKAYLSSVGTQYEYDFFQGGLLLIATLADGESKFEDYESIYSKTFTGLKNRDAEFKEYFTESLRFIHAPTIEPGKKTVIMNPDVAGVFTHESFGHKSEADFLLADLSAADEWKLGKKVGSDNLSIVDCGQFDDSSGDCPIDDEGNLAQKTYLIKNGVLAGRLHSSETAFVLNEPITGNARAKDFEYEPLVRMTSTYIEPGNQTFDELVASCKEGVYIVGYKHGSGGSTFTIAPNRSYLIKDGKIDQPVRVSVISGSLFETLYNIKGIANDFKNVSGAFGGCGKMAQWPLSVADGGPSILVTNMQVS